MKPEALFDKLHERRLGNVGRGNPPHVKVKAKGGNFRISHSGEVPNLKVPNLEDEGRK